jgi:hypothetical protein
MIVCTICGMVFKCEQTGVIARWRKSYSKRGDMYKCPGCNTRIIQIDESTSGYTDTAQIHMEIICEVQDVTE